MVTRALTNFEVSKDLHVTCFIRNGEDLMFAVREFDAKVRRRLLAPRPPRLCFFLHHLVAGLFSSRGASSSPRRSQLTCHPPCAQVIRLPGHYNKSRGPSEQAIRASIRQAVSACSRGRVQLVCRVHSSDGAPRVAGGPPSKLSGLPQPLPWRDSCAAPADSRALLHLQARRAALFEGPLLAPSAWPQAPALSRPAGGAVAPPALLVALRDLLGRVPGVDLHFGPTLPARYAPTETNPPFLVPRSVPFCRWGSGYLPTPRRTVCLCSPPRPPLHCRTQILNLKLSSERASKMEIRLLKNQGILGKRAPSCTLLSAEDMAKLLGTFGKDDTGEELVDAVDKVSTYVAAGARSLSQRLRARGINHAFSEQPLIKSQLSHTLSCACVLVHRQAP